MIITAQYSGCEYAKFYTIAAALLLSEPLWYLLFFSPRAESLRTCFLLFLYTAKRPLSTTFCFPVFKLLPVQKKSFYFNLPSLYLWIGNFVSFSFCIIALILPELLTIYFRSLWILTDSFFWTTLSVCVFCLPHFSAVYFLLWFMYKELILLRS